MAFVEIENVTKSPSAVHSGIAAGLAKLRVGRALLRFTVRPDAMRQIGWDANEAVSVLIGEGEDHGIIRLRKNKEGAFRFFERSGMKATRYMMLSLGHRPEFIDRTEAAEPCQWEMVDADTLEIILPKWADETAPKKKVAISALPAPMKSMKEAGLAEAAHIKEQRDTAMSVRTARELDEQRAAEDDFQRHLTAAPKDEWKHGLGLTKSEAALLTILTDRFGRLVTKEQIYLRIYGDTLDRAPDDKIIDIFICKLRPKLTGLDVKITTVWGEGYKIEGDLKSLTGGV